MNKEIFQAIMEEESKFDKKELDGVQTKYYDKFPVKVATKDS